MHVLTAALLLAALQMPAVAQTVRGTGARPCTDWNQARRGGGRAFEAEQWTLGYMSGVNASAGARQGSLFRTIDEKNAFAAIDAYCALHPEEMLWNAVKSAIAASHGA